MSVVSSKNQVTIPVDVLREAGVAPGDDLRILGVGPGRIELRRTEDLLMEHAGSLDGAVYPAAYLDELRDEWA